MNKVFLNIIIVISTALILNNLSASDQTSTGQSKKMTMIVKLNNFKKNNAEKSNALCGAALNENKSNKTETVGVVPLTKSQQKMLAAKLSVSGKGEKAGSDSSVDYTDLGSPVYANGYKNQIQNFPVLNQGSDGTCHMFASMEAAEVLHGQGDVYSIKDELELLQYLAANKDAIPDKLYDTLSSLNEDPYANGGLALQDLTLIKNFGVSSLDSAEKSEVENPEPGVGLDNDGEGVKKSAKDLGLSLMSPNIDFNNLYSSSDSTSSFIDKIKNNIDSGKVVTIGIALCEDSNNGCAGKYYLKNDGTQNNVWVMTSDVKSYLVKYSNDPNKVGGHALLVVGYINSKSNPDDGVFIVRNSWGPNAGDHGNYYIDFNYLAAMNALEGVYIPKAQAI